MRIPVKNSASWGDDVKDLATFVANFDAAFYKLYVVDPSEQNIMVFDPSSDGSGYHSAGTGRLPTDRAGRRDDRPHDRRRHLRRRERRGGAGDPGRRAGTPSCPTDTQLRPTTRLHDALVADPGQRQPRAGAIGALYAFDATNHRVVAFNKSDGKYLGQYQLTGDDDAWSDLKGLDVLPAAEADAPSTMWWISSKGLNSAAARGGRPETPIASPTPGPDARPRRRDAQADEDSPSR